MPLRFFISAREPVMLLFHGILLACVIVLSTLDTQLGGVGVVFVLIVISTMTFGIVGMLNFASIADIAGASMVATMAAILTGVSYVCSSFAGVAMGWLVQQYGFLPWKLMLLGSAGVGVLCMASLVYMREKKESDKNNNNDKTDLPRELRKEHQESSPLLKNFDRQLHPHVRDVEMLSIPSARSDDSDVEIEDEEEYDYAPRRDAKYTRYIVGQGHKCVVG